MLPGSPGGTAGGRARGRRGAESVTHGFFFSIFRAIALFREPQRRPRAKGLGIHICEGSAERKKEDGRKGKREEGTGRKVEGKARSATQKAKDGGGRGQRAKGEGTEKERGQRRGKDCARHRQRAEGGRKALIPASPLPRNRQRRRGGGPAADAGALGSRAGRALPAPHDLIRLSYAPLLLPSRAAAAVRSRRGEDGPTGIYL